MKNQKKFLRRWIMIALLYIPLGWAFAALNANDSKSADKPKVLVETTKLIEDMKTVLVPARVEAKVQSLVSADVEGHVVQILKPLGASVRVGETVLFLENKDPGFTYAKVPVRSPISGVISQFQIGPMARVARGDRLFVVMDPKHLKLSAEISSLDAELLHSGSLGVFKSANGEFPIRVVGLSPLVDSRTGTAAAELEFVPVQETKKQLIGSAAVGVIGQASFENKKGRILLLPETSLTYQQGKPFVRVINDKKQVEKRPVVLGEQRESFFVAKSGILPGETLILRSSRPVKEGEAIEIEGEQSQSPETK